jgi:hypothetical protein
MSRARYRQIARLEKLAQPYIQRQQQIEQERRLIPHDAASHAAILAFVIRYGDPEIGEPLSCAWERFINGPVWNECCNKWEAMALEQLGDEGKEYGDETALRNRLASIPRSYRVAWPYGRDGVLIIGSYLRHELIASFPGATEKKKLERVFASAPPWLIWFTFADYTAELLGLSLPDLSSIASFARSKADFDNWCGLPSGAFVRRAWPDGPDNEALARTDLNLLRPATQRPIIISPTTRREHRRAHAIGLNSHSAKSTADWPDLISLEYLTMPFKKQWNWIQNWIQNSRRRKGG